MGPIFAKEIIGNWSRAPLGGLGHGSWRRGWAWGFGKLDLVLRTLEPWLRGWEILGFGAYSSFETGRGFVNVLKLPLAFETLRGLGGRGAAARLTAPGHSSFGFGM